MRYIAIIIVSFLLVITLTSARECFQESANQSTITDTHNCGLKYTGHYSGDETVYRNLWVDGGVNGGLGHNITSVGWHDSDYLTFSVIVQNVPVYVNYSIPDNTTSAKWSVIVPAGVITEYNSSSGNFSVPNNCINNIFAPSNILQIKITNDYDWTSNSSGPGLFHVNCWNYSSSSWYEFWTQKTPNVWMFEESMWWNVSSSFQPVVSDPPLDSYPFAKSMLKLTIGIISLALILGTILWVGFLMQRGDVSLKKIITIFAFLIIGLALLQLLASLVNKL